MFANIHEYKGFIMARPMILIQQELLEKLWESHQLGVPICKLIAVHDLNITPPTLTKLISYMEAKDEAKFEKVVTLIENSLYPPWLVNSNLPVVKQPNTYRYTGKFPLGQWEAV